MLPVETSQVDLILDALGDQTRRSILALLRTGAQPVGVIAAQLPISRPAVSKHLRILQGAGLVGYHEEGTRNIFYLKPSGFRAVSLYLNLFWAQALDNFKRLAEEDHLPEQ